MFIFYAFMFYVRFSYATAMSVCIYVLHFNFGSWQMTARMTLMHQNNMHVHSPLWWMYSNCNLSLLLCYCDITFDRLLGLSHNFDLIERQNSRFYYQRVVFFVMLLVIIRKFCSCGTYLLIERYFTIVVYAFDRQFFFYADRRARRRSEFGRPQQ